MTRRDTLRLPGMLLAPQRSQKVAGLMLNEDPNHYYASRAPHRVTAKELTAWVDQYAGTQVRELLLCVNAMRTAFASKAWTPFWKDYDPAGADDQRLFASLKPEERKFARAWVHTAWQMNADGLDHLQIWTQRAKEKGLSPWLSIRMNDLHNVEDEQHYLHSDFWKAHPEFRRIPYRGEMRDKALDFGHKAVRDYTFQLIEEVTRHYEFDGLELDWMRHGYHFAPGREAEGAVLLNGFMRDVRKLLGSKKKIGVRVPPHPESAVRLGLDAVTWAKEGTADMVVPTNFWRTVDTDMPVALWRQLLPSSCLLGAGLELGLNPYLGSRAAGDKPYGYNSLTTVRGAAAAYLQQGADRIYLFNYMDSQTAIQDLQEYPILLRECGSLATLAGKKRRHVVTYCDTWAPGETPYFALPANLEAGRWRAFRLATGPVDARLSPRVRLGSREEPAGWMVRVNGQECKAVGLERAELPWPNGRVFGWEAPKASLRDGETVIEVSVEQAAQIDWVELAWLP